MIFECLELSMSQVKESNPNKSKNHPKTFICYLFFCKIEYCFTLRNNGLSKARPARPVTTLLTPSSYTVWLISFIEIIFSHFSHKQVSLQK